VSNQAEDRQDPDAVETQLEHRVREVLDAIRPAVRSDGGDLELVEVSEAGGVKIRFLGACVGCPSREITLRAGVEHNLRTLLPEVTSVEAIA
jgi:Fe-S cluster biogenesis protein NfuA